MRFPGKIFENFVEKFFVKVMEAGVHSLRSPLRGSNRKIKRFFVLITENLSQL